jgi:hypothetical protein
VKINSWGRTSKLSSFVLVRGLVEEEISGELFVLVAGKVGLDDEVALEAKTAQLYAVSGTPKEHYRCDLHAR